MEKTSKSSDLVDPGGGHWTPKEFELGSESKAWKKMKWR